MSDCSERRGELFTHGLAVIEAAKAATEMTILASPQTTMYQHQGGWTVNEVTYEMGIPHEQQEFSGRILNTHPARTVAVRFDQIDRGAGFETPIKLQFASRLPNHGEPTSKFSNVFVAKYEAPDIICAKADTGFVHGVFGAANTSNTEFSDLRSFAKVINTISSKTREL